MLYSSVAGTKNSDKGYEHAVKVWNEFKMKTMKVFHDLYLNCNVCCLLMFLKKLETIAEKILNYTQVII